MECTLVIIMYGCLSGGQVRHYVLLVASYAFAPLCCWSTVVQAHHYATGRWLCRRAIRNCCLSIGHARHYVLLVICYPCVPLSCWLMVVHKHHYGLRFGWLGVLATMLLGVSGPGGPVCHWSCTPLHGSPSHMLLLPLQLHPSRIIRHCACPNPGQHTCISTNNDNIYPTSSPRLLQQNPAHSFWHLQFRPFLAKWCKRSWPTNLLTCVSFCRTTSLCWRNLRGSQRLQGPPGHGCGRCRRC